LRASPLKENISDMSELLTNISALIIEGNFKEIAEATRGALDSGLSASDVLESGLMPGMDHVGTEFKAGNLFVPEVLMSAKAMQEAMNILRPILVETGVEPAGKIIIGTVKGDLHDIGKNLVAMMCEGAGFEVIDLGKDIDPQVFVDEVREHQPDMVAMSALLTTTMAGMERTIQALVEAGLREEVKVIIGGAPVTQEFAARIGADGYAPNAAAASELARQLIG
jgi:5-methyltetrahydrofolate--homocysteine methyltransferase